MPDTLIIGIAVADAIARTVEALPAPGGLRFFDDLTLATGGCAVNAAIALAKLGIPCDVAARVGADAFGDFLLAEIRRHGLSTDLVTRDPARGTSFSFVAVSAAGERSFLHTTGANAALAPAHIPAAALKSRRFVLLTGVMLMDGLDGEPAAALLRAARAGGAATLMDTVYVESASRMEWFRRVLPAIPHLDYFVPSFPEARAITGLGDPGVIAMDLQRGGVRNVAVKLGEKGVFCRDHTGRETLVPAFPVKRVVDATGAGDCWCAGFLAGLRESLPMHEAARLGNAVAAMGIQAAGATAGVPDYASVRAFMACR